MLFVDTQVGAKGIAIEQFIKGLRDTFGIFFAISLIAAFISYLRGPQPRWNLKYRVIGEKRLDPDSDE